MKTSLLLSVLAASPAHADMPPTEFLSAHIEVSKDAQVIGRSPRGKRESIPAPRRSMDIYVWRERGDAPVVVTERTKPGELGSRGQTADFTFSLASDLFKIEKPRPAVVVTGSESMTIDTSAIVKVSPFSGPLNGHQTSSFLTVSEKQAKLLRSGPPVFICNLGHESPESSTERYLLSWDKKGSAKKYEPYCVEKPDSPQRIEKEQLKALSEKDKIVVLEYHEDDC